MKGKPVYELLSFDEGEEADPAVRVYASGGVMWTYYDRGDGESFGVEELIAEALEYKGPALPADPNTHIGSVHRRRVVGESGAGGRRERGTAWASGRHQHRVERCPATAV